MRESLRINGATPEGRVIVGRFMTDGTSGERAFRLDSLVGAIEIPQMPYASTRTVASGVDYSGNRIVGFKYGEDGRPSYGGFVWNLGDQYPNFLRGPLDGNAIALGISGDGRVVVGRADFPDRYTCPNCTRAAFWIADRVFEVGTLDGFRSSSAIATDETGSIILGVSFNSDPVSGRFVSSQVFVWRAGTGPVALDGLGGHSDTNAFSLSGNGRFAVGWSGRYDASGDGPRQRPVFWEIGGKATEIVLPTPYEQGYASTITTDGSLVAGFYTVRAEGSNRTVGKLFLWRRSTGLKLIDIDYDFYHLPNPIALINDGEALLFDYLDPSGRFRIASISTE